jgi:hypothetical protein
MRQDIICHIDAIKYQYQAEAELEALCKEQGIDYLDIRLYRWEKLYVDKLRAILDDILSRYRVSKNFKVGDKVYVEPDRPTRVFEHYIRATVTSVDEKKGYELRAFKEDLPGIYMFNIWDRNLILRVGKSKKKLPDDFPRTWDSML